MWLSSNMKYCHCALFTMFGRQPTPVLRSEEHDRSTPASMARSRLPASSDTQNLTQMFTPPDPGFIEKKNPSLTEIQI